MNILRKFKPLEDIDELPPATPREIVLEHAMILRRSAHRLSVIYSSTVITGGHGCDPSVFQGFLKSTATSLETAASNMEDLAERAKRSPMGMPAWRFILQMGGAMGVGLVLASGVLVGAVWLFDSPSRQSPAFGEQVWIASPNEGTSGGDSKP